MNLKNVSRWELGQAKPSLEAAAELAKTLGVGLDWLAGLKTEENGIMAQLCNALDKLPEEKIKALWVLVGEEN